MKKTYHSNMKGDIDYIKIFEMLPQITGLPFVRRGPRWYAACRMDGEPHKRWDKTVASIHNNKVRLMEQGGDSLPVIDWLIKYGGVGDVKGAIGVLKEKGSAKLHIPPPPPEPRLRYIWPSVLYLEKKKIGTLKDGLFLWLERHFPVQDIEDCYRRYNITPNKGKSGIETVFWNVDALSRVCKDKRIIYKSDGHRNRDARAYSQYKTRDGYRGKCLFGIQGAKWVVESEKTAICCALYFGGDWAATGGKNNTSLITDGHMLFPDIDAYDAWEKQFPGQCVKWWEYLAYDYGEKDDLADYIFNKIENGQ